MSPPNQRLPEKIYLRRRIAAAVILVLIVALFIWIVSSCTARDESEPTVAAPTTTSALPPTTTTTASPTTTTTATASPTTTATTAGSTCVLADLKITAQTSRPDYSAKEQPVFYLTVTNPTGADCVIDVDEQPLRFEVYDLSTNARIWSDIDCNDPVESGTATFPAGEERNFQAVWSRTTSAPKQCTNRAEVPAGGYFLHAVLGDNPSDAVPFNLA